MEFQLQQAIEILGTTPGVLSAMLAKSGPHWVMSHYGKDTFSPFDVVGHLIHGERTDWIPRARMILEHGQSKSFKPFDRYAMYEDSKGQSIGDLLATFSGLREENLAALQSLNLTPDKLPLRGTHPELGRVKLSELLATWVVHDLNHVAQIAKAMAFQYRDAVGPWAQYISILPKG